MLARLLSGSDGKWHYQRVALLLALALGLGLRVFNYVVHPPTLWQDEAYWAINTLKRAAIDAQIRPLGFMLTTQGLLRWFGPAAWVYRLLPFVGSVASMLLMPYVATRLFKSIWAQLMAVLLLAVSPVALEMAVEFKHYGGEVGVYVGVLAAFLFHRERGSWRSLVLLLGIAWLSFFFSITIIFVYPALFAALLYGSFRGKQWRRLVGVAGVALVCLATIGTIYFTTWRSIKTGKAENKWGTWYDVFYLKNGLKTQYDSRLAWSSVKYFELAAVPGVGRALWSTERVSAPKLERLKQADLVLWGALHVAGVAFLLRRRRFTELALLWGPLLCVTGFNLAGRWPAGAFRTNTFYTPFAILLASYACEWLAVAIRTPVLSQTLDASLRRWLAPGLLVLLLLPTAYFRAGLVEKGLWAKPGRFTDALAALPRKPAKAERMLLMDYESCHPWNYYTAYDRPIGELGPELGRAYKKRCVRQGRKLWAEMTRLSKQQRGFWMLLTDPRKYDGILATAKKRCTRVETTRIAGQTHLVVHCSQRK